MGTTAPSVQITRQVRHKYRGDWLPSAVQVPAYVDGTGNTPVLSARDQRGLYSIQADPNNTYNIELTGPKSPWGQGTVLLPGAVAELEGFTGRMWATADPTATAPQVLRVTELDADVEQVNS